MIDRVVKTCEIDMLLLSIPAFGLFLHSKFQKYALELMRFYTGEHLSLSVFMPKVGQHVDSDISPSGCHMF